MYRGSINPIPIFLISLSLILFSYLRMSSTSDRIPVPATTPPRGFHFKYTVQKGHFMQSEDSTNDKEFDFKRRNFGLIDRSYTTDEEQDSGKQWLRFERYVRHVNSSAEKGQSAKVLFLGRHGQGWHNVGEAKYGTKAWDCYWSALDGAEGITWTDALLTPLGQQQAKDANAVWKEQLPHGIPTPETYYVSPLTRAIETADLSFNTLDLPQGKPYQPLVKELLREALGMHTCDRRSTKTHIEKTFPHVAFEPGFSESDLLWEKDYREPNSARNYRLAQLLDDVFATDENVFLSMTAHSGTIGSILEVVGHRTFALETGGVIPVFVKAERVDGEREVPPKEPSAAPPICDGPPQV